ncbi:MAG: hypothetical protein PVSMB11_05250 [Desulfuromonadaceae bacterium]
MAFELWRQDDNGNRFLVDSFNERSAAEKCLADLKLTKIPNITKPTSVRLTV